MSRVELALRCCTDTAQDAPHFRARPPRTLRSRFIHPLHVSFPIIGHCPTFLKVARETHSHTRIPMPLHPIRRRRSEPLGSAPDQRLRAFHPVRGILLAPVGSGCPCPSPFGERPTDGEAGFVAHTRVPTLIFSGFRKSDLR